MSSAESRGSYDIGIIEQTFIPFGRHFLTESINDDRGTAASPPYLIAAMLDSPNRLPSSVSFEIPEAIPGLRESAPEAEQLDELERRFCRFGARAVVTVAQAGQFVEVANQIMQLNEDGGINPPLTLYEKESFGLLAAALALKQQHNE